MKKFPLLLVFISISMLVNALPTWYCGKNGNLFHIRWTWLSVQQTWHYEIVPTGGKCLGGPWAANIALASPQEAAIEDMAEATGDVYRTFANPEPSNATPEELSTDIAEAAAFITPDMNSVYVNPHFIDAVAARELAIKNGRSIYALSLKDHPFNKVIRFEIWSVKAQDISVSVKNIKTGEMMHSAGISVKEGVNRSESIILPGNIRGTHLLVIESTENTITRTVFIQ